MNGPRQFISEPPPPAKTDSWESFIRIIIPSVLDHDTSSISFEECYRTAYNMVVNGCTDRLQRALVSELEKYHLKFVDSWLPLTQEQSIAEKFMSSICAHWTKYSEGLKSLSGIFMYKDNRAKGKKSTWDTGLESFRDNIIRTKAIKNCLLWSILSQIQRERNGEQINTLLLKNTINLLAELKDTNGSALYSTEFESVLIQETKNYYTKEAELAQQKSATEYLALCHQRLEEERQRLRDYLKASSSSIIQVVENVLILHHPCVLPQEKLAKLFCQLSDLSSLFNLIKDKRQVLDLGKEVSRHILSHDLESIQTHEQWMEKSIRLFRKTESIMACCDHHKAIERMAEESLELVISKNPKSAEYLAQHIDVVLQSDAELDSEVCCRLLSFVSEKEVFESVYFRLLSQRLINLQVSVDTERQVVGMLSDLLGQSFSRNGDRLLTDYTTSKEMVKEFGNDSFSVIVLTSGTFPHVEYSLELPLWFQEMKKSFCEVYQKSHINRTIKWQFHLGSIVLKAKFVKQHEITLSPFLGLILLQFNEKKWHSTADIVSRTGIPKQEAKACLECLANGRQKLLLKSPESQNIEEDDVFRVNEDFEEKKYKFKIAFNLSLVTNAMQSAKHRKKEHHDRSNAVDAMIIKCMKSEKKLTHADLVSRVFAALKSRFGVTSAVIKERIEALIDREFLARTEDRCGYTYVA